MKRAENFFYPKELELLLELERDRTGNSTGKVLNRIDDALTDVAGTAAGDQLINLLQVVLIDCRQQRRDVERAREQYEQRRKRQERALEDLRYDMQDLFLQVQDLNSELDYELGREGTLPKEWLRSSMFHWNRESFEVNGSLFTAKIDHAFSASKSNSYYKLRVWSKRTGPSETCHPTLKQAVEACEKFVVDGKVCSSDFMP